AVIVQVSHGQRADFPGAEGVPRPDHAAGTVVDGELVGVAADDHLGRPVTGQVGNDHAGPDAVGACRPPLQAAVCAVQRHDVGCGPDDVRQAVAVEVRHRGGGIPPGLPGR